MTPEEKAEEYVWDRIRDGAAYGDLAEELKDAYLAGYKAAQPQSDPATSSGWISVKDRLPEDEQVITLKLRESNGLRFACLDIVSGYGDLDDFGFVHTQCGDRTTHWMPLPEPPKEEE